MVRNLKFLLLSIFLILLTNIFISSSSFANDIGKPFIEEGHSSGVDSIALSPDGLTVVSSGYPGVIKFWDVLSGKLIKTISSGQKSISFSPDGRYLLSGGEYDLNLHNVSSGKLIKSFDEPGDVSSVAFSPDGKKVVSTNSFSPYEYSLKIWDVQSGTLINDLSGLVGHSKDISSVAFSPNGKLIVSGSADRTLKLWDTISGKRIRTFRGHLKGVNSVTFSPDGNTIVSSSYDNTLKFWDVTTGKLIKNIKWSIIPNSVDFSPDGKQLVFSGAGQDNVNLMDVKTGKLIKSFSGHSDSVNSVSFSSDGKYLVSGSEDKTIKIWDVSKKQLSKTFPVLSQRTNKIERVAHSPDGRFFVTSAEYEEKLKLWDASNGSLIRTLKGPFIGSVIYSPDGQFLVSGGSDKKIKFWNAVNGKLTRTFVGHKEQIDSIVFSRDGKKLASGSQSGILKVWDVTTGKLTDTIEAHLSSIKSMVFSPSSQYLISFSSDLNSNLWDLSSNTLIKSFKGKVFDNVAFDANESSILHYNYGILSWWNVKNGKQVKKIKVKVGEDYKFTTFSNSGKQILFSDANGKTKLWNIQDEKMNSTSLTQTISDGVNKFTSTLAFNGGVIISPNSQYLPTTGLNEKFAKHRQVNFVTFMDGEWIVITDDGYFNSSKHGAKYLNIQTSPLNATGIDAYYEKFYRPDIVKLALLGKPSPAEENIANIKTPPRVEIINTANLSNKDNVKVTLKITDLGGGIGDIRLYRNDTAIKLDGSRGLIRKKQTDKILIKDYVIKLENGTNEIKAIAFDKKNWGRSEYATHLVTANIQARKPALHAVIIGIDNYRSSKLNLKYAVADAELFSKSINKYSKSLFSEIKVDLLVTKSDTSKDAISAKLKEMQDLNPEDLFVFYVASHGTVDDGSYFMITSNVGSTSTHKLKQDALSQDTIKNLISNIPTTKKIIILDTCNSQAMGDSLQVAMMTRGMSEDTAMKVLSRAVGSTILSASSSTQQALEGYKGHGLFTHVLAEGLKGHADSNKDGFVKTNELADYIEDNVPELAEKVFNREQFPTTARNGLAYPIAKVK